MKTIIIAAGRGSRFEDRCENIPKPLIEISGISLIERVILTHKEAGINEFIIVIGYLGNLIRNKLGDGTALGVKINYVENKEWHRPNGVSALCGAESVKDEQYLLVMSDHLYGKKFVVRLIDRAKSDKKNVYLCADKNIEEVADIEDATKVIIDENNNITEIDKKLTVFNGVDCGVFLGNQNLTESLRKAIDAGNESLTQANKLLAEKGLFKAEDLTGNFWIDIDDNKSIEYLKSNLNKLGKTK